MSYRGEGPEQFAGLGPAKVTKLKELLKARQDAGLALENFKESLVADAPVKIGDVITVNGWSHNGRKMKVTSAYLYLNNDAKEMRWVARGNVLKKNGEPGLGVGKSHWTLNDAS